MLIVTLGTAGNSIAPHGTAPSSLILPFTICCQVNVTSSLLQCFISTEVSPACLYQQRVVHALETEHREAMRDQIRGH